MLNSIVIMGRLTADPELKVTQGGTPVCSFTVAVDRDFQRQGEEKQTDFIDVVAWRSTAEFVSRYFPKGRMIVVQGSLQSRKWQDRDGNKRVSWEVQADKVFFAGSKSGEEPASEPRKVPDRDAARGEPLTPNSYAVDFMPIPDEDLPF